MLIRVILFCGAVSLWVACSKEGDPPKTPGILQLVTARVGTQSLDLQDPSKNRKIETDKPIVIAFAEPLDTTTVRAAVKLVKATDTVAIRISYLDEFKTISFQTTPELLNKQWYQIVVKKSLKSKTGSVFPGTTLGLETKPGALTLQTFTINGTNALSSAIVRNTPLSFSAEMRFSAAVNTAELSSTPVELSMPGGTVPLDIKWSDGNTKLSITSTQPLAGLTRYRLAINSSMVGVNGEEFSPYNRIFYSAIDPEPKFPLIADEELLTLVQKQTFNYFYDFAHASSGMARERNTSGDIVTSGGSGFGIMALIVGMERGFISRAQGLERIDKILDFLETADRFHGAWSHWINGNTGKVVPFSTKDNGGDLVETSFLVQGLITFRQYLNATDPDEKTLVDRINSLWEAVEWDWYRKNSEDVLYWHWSSNYNWEMNFAMYGYFEEQITYFLAAASPTHGIPKKVYTNGYGRNGAIKTGNNYYNITLPLGSPSPLFWVHYSYLGLDPHFTDDFANYWEQNVNATRINQAYCISNPKNYIGYSENCWGLTSSDNQDGYNAHSPSNDLGVISPTAALSSFPYTPTESMKALKFFYYTLGDRTWGSYGFYDAFNLTEGWFANSYLAIDQGPIIVMIENYRSGLLWNLFMSAPEVQAGMTKLGFMK